MNTVPTPKDTIVAQATAPGIAGVAVIRLSGPDAITIARKIFQQKNRKQQFPPRNLIYGNFLDCAGELIDEGLYAEMPGPNSFTGEDVVEFQCHGSPAIIRSLIEESITNGARIAEPGEFSKRAFLNNRIDLVQAEALCDLISAQSELSRKAALRQLRGGLSNSVRQIHSELIDAAAEIEAHLDFPDEDIPEFTQDRVLGIIQSGKSKIENLIKTFHRGKVLREGVRVVLAGEPNAGKSSLFNYLLGRERAIVSPHAGTTRDTIEATLDIKGLTVTLVDTAGIRDSSDEIEKLGIDRSLQEIETADIVLQVFNPQFTPIPVPASDKSIKRIPVATHVDALTEDNKTEVKNQLESLHGTEFAFVSTFSGEGIDQLENLLLNTFQIHSNISEEVEVSRLRHVECLQAAVNSLNLSSNAFSAGESGEFVMVDLRDALSYLCEILGERLDEQILDRVFSTFCLGK